MRRTCTIRSSWMTVSVEDRQAGMEMSLALLQRVDELWCFGDRVTEGMTMELQAARQENLPIRYFNDRCEEMQ